MARGRKAPRDSVEARHRKAQADAWQGDPPPGVKLNKEERIVWDHLVEARRAEDWRLVELYKLAEIAQLEVEKRTAMAAYRKSQDPDDFAHYDRIAKLQNQNYRLLALGVRGNMADTKNRNGKSVAGSGRGKKPARGPEAMRAIVH